MPMRPGSSCMRTGFPPRRMRCGWIWSGVQSGATAQEVRSNRDAVGARVVASFNGRSLHREKRAGEGFASQNTGWLHFGLGESESIDALVVHWPSGQTTEIKGPIQSRTAYTDLRILVGLAYALELGARFSFLALNPPSPEKA